MVIYIELYKFMRVDFLGSLGYLGEAAFDNSELSQLEWADLVWFGEFGERNENEC